jgi:hypothetical protein
MFLLLLVCGGSLSVTGLEELRSATVSEMKDGIRIGRMRAYSATNDWNEMIGTVTDFIVGRNLSLFVILQIGAFPRL